MPIDWWCGNSISLPAVIWSVHETVIQTVIAPDHATPASQPNTFSQTCNDTR